MFTAAALAQQIAAVAPPIGSQDQYWTAIAYVVANGLLGIVLGGVGLWAVHRAKG